MALKTYSGSIDVELPSDTSAHFDLQSFSGDLSVELENGRTRHRSRGPGHNLDFQTGDASARVSAEAFSGSVRIVASD